MWLGTVYLQLEDSVKLSKLCVKAHINVSLIEWAIVAIGIGNMREDYNTEMEFLIWRFCPYCHQECLIRV